MLKLRPGAGLRRRLRPVVIVPAVALGVAGSAVPVTVSTMRLAVTIGAVRQDALVGEQALAGLTFVVTPVGTSARSVRLRLDGRPVRGDVRGGRVVYHPGRVADGAHVLTATVMSALRLSSARASRRFVVDTAPPVVTVAQPAPADSLRSPVTVTGTAVGAVELTVGGSPVKLTDGRFTVRLDTPPVGVPLVATDAAGNSAERLLTVSVRHPMMRGVHVTGYGWNYAGLRDPVLALARAHRINTIELDIKEEDGFVDFDTSVRLAHTTGAVRTLYDPRRVVAKLHKMGVRVVGRIVAFRDPVLATWAWNHGHHDWVVQTPGGGPYRSSSYGGIAFTNFANPQVRAYNIALAAEAAKLGFDDVMYDYVRRPDGPVSGMRFVGLRTGPQTAIADFVRDSRAPVHDNGAFLAAAVFGVSATRPAEVAQSVPLLARYVDYVAPMVYPSHWAPGEYGVPDPNAQPYEIVQRSLLDFRRQVAGTQAQVYPWLQDFSLGVDYDAAHVVAQIHAARDDGLGSFLLWDAGCRYHADALPVIRR